MVFVPIIFCLLASTWAAAYFLSLFFSNSYLLLLFFSEAFLFLDGDLADFFWEALETLSFSA